MVGSRTPSNWTSRWTSRTAAIVAIALVASCASPPSLPLTPSSYRVEKEEFDRYWEAAILVVNTYFDEGFAHVNKAERRIESNYFYPASGLSRQKAEVRIDPLPDGAFVVRVRTTVEQLSQELPPRWVIKGPDVEANRLLLEEIRKGAARSSDDRSPPPPRP